MIHRSLVPFLGPSRIQILEIRMPIVAIIPHTHLRYFILLFIDTCPFICRHWSNLDFLLNLFSYACLFINICHFQIVYVFSTRLQGSLYLSDFLRWLNDLQEVFLGILLLFQLHRSETCLAATRPQVWPLARGGPVSEISRANLSRVSIRVEALKTFPVRFADIDQLLTLHSWSISHWFPAIP